MSDIPEDIKEAAKKLTYDAWGPQDDPLTDRRIDPNDPKSKIHLHICVDPTITKAHWGGIAEDFKKPSEDMVQQVKWAWEDIVNHPRLKGHIEVEFVTGNEDADITYFSATSTPGTKPWSGLTRGWKDDKGKVRKEVLLNPNPAPYNSGFPPLEAWIHTDRYNHPNDRYNPRNRHGNASRLVKHETGHAMGLVHWGYQGFGDIRAVRNPDVNTDLTIMAYPLGKNTQYDFRPIDWEALASMYVAQELPIRQIHSAVPMSATKTRNKKQPGR